MKAKIVSLFALLFAISLPLQANARQMLGVCEVEVGMAGTSPTLMRGAWVYPTEPRCIAELPGKCNYYQSMAQILAFGQTIDGIAVGHGARVNAKHKCYPMNDPKVKDIPKNRVVIYSEYKDKVDQMVKVNLPEMDMPPLSSAPIDAHRHLLPEGYLPGNDYQTTRLDRVLTAASLTVLAAPFVVASWVAIGPTLATIELAGVGSQLGASAAAASVATVVVKNVSEEDLRYLDDLVGEEFENGADLAEELSDIVPPARSEIED